MYVCQFEIMLRYVENFSFRVLKCHMLIMYVNTFKCYRSNSVSKREDES